MISTINGGANLHTSQLTKQKNIAASTKSYKPFWMLTITLKKTIYNHGGNFTLTCIIIYLLEKFRFSIEFSIGPFIFIFIFIFLFIFNFI
jgi:hypothetical protein